MLLDPRARKNQSAGREKPSQGWLSSAGGEAG